MEKVLTIETLNKIFAKNKLYRIEYMGYEPNHYTKFGFLTDQVFDLTTYDGSISDEWGKIIYEVLCVIRDRKNFDYIEDENNYNKYLLVCNILDSFQWIEWGTSIRGAWFDENERSRPLLYLYSDISYEYSLENLLTLFDWLGLPEEPLEKIEGVQL